MALLGLPRGANASATIYGMGETATAIGLAPYHTLRFPFAKLPQARQIGRTWRMDRFCSYA